MVYPCPPPEYGGLESVVADLSEELGKLGHNVYVLCPGGSEGGEHYKVLTPVAASLANPEGAAYEAARPSLFDYDIIHSHSLSGDAKIFVCLGGSWTYLRLVDLFDACAKLLPRACIDGSDVVYTPSGYLKTHTIDQKGAAHIVNVPYVLRHRNRRPLVSVQVQGGLSVKVTPEHLLFQTSRTGLLPIQAVDSIGKRVVAPASLPVNAPDIPTISMLLDALPDQRLYVRHPALAQRLPTRTGQHTLVLDKAPNLQLRSAYTNLSRWRQGSFVPLWFAQKLGGDWTGGSIAGSHGKTIPLTMPLSDPLLTAMGLWIGDGSYGSCGIEWAISGEAECMAVVREAMAPLEVHVAVAKGKGRKVHACSSALKALWRGVGLTGNSHTKRIPQWVFNLSSRQIGAFLKGYWSADAGFRSHSLVLCSVSGELLEDTRLLMLRLGIWSTLRRGTGGGYKGSGPSYELSVDQYDWGRFHQEVGLLQLAKQDRLKTARQRRFSQNRKGSTRLEKVKAVEAMPTEQWVYDLAVPPWERFVANGLLVHNSWAGYPYLAKREHEGRLKVLQTLHGPCQFWSKPVDKPCFVAASQAHARYLKTLVGFECRVVHHGIDLERHQPGNGARGDYLLFLARVAPEKGALEFVELCRQVRMPGLLVGDDVFPPDKEYIRMVMRRCEDTNGLVRYMGPAAQEWKVELLQQARCLVTPVQPPYIEIWGLSTTESMACGTPVLSTDVGAAREQIIDGETGAVVANTDGLVDGLTRALQCEPAACRRRAEDFPRERMAREYAELYERMLAGEEW